MKSMTRMTGDERHGQLLAVARACFIERGYRATTGQVAEAAGVSEALVIKHFGTKADLFRAAVATPLLEVFEQALRKSSDRAASQELSTPREHLDELLRFGAEWASLVSENRSLILSIARETVEFPDITQQLLALLGEVINDVADTLTNYAATADYVDFDPRMATYSALGALTAAALVMEDPPAFARDYFEMTFRGVLSDGGRAQLGAAQTGRER